VETRYAAARIQDEPAGCGGGLGGGLGFDLISSCGSDAPHLGVSCQPNPLTAGNTTTCTAAVDPATPFTVRTWHFASDAPGVTADDTGDHKSWTFAPSVSGTVTVTATVAGSLQMATVHVQVNCNLAPGATGDPILNDPGIQAGFRRLWAETKVGTSTAAERGAMIMLRDGHYFLKDYIGPSSRCESGAGNMTVDGAVIVGFVHTHPDKGGIDVPTDGSCKGNTAPNMIFTDGPSLDADRPSSDSLAVRLGRRVDGYIIDRDHIHRYGGPLPDALFARNPTCP
jgi:hypothetical protein